MSQVLSASARLSPVLRCTVTSTRVLVGGSRDEPGHYPEGVNRRRFPRAVAALAVVYLLAMAVVFALLSAQNADFVRTASRTQGTVVALVARAPLGSTQDARPDARAPSLAPKVTYVVAGQTYTYVAAHGRYRLRLQVGDHVTVLYSPSDPTTARLRGEGQDLGPLLSAGFALSAVLVVLLSIRFRRRTRGPGPGPGAARASAPPSPVVAD